MEINALLMDITDNVVTCVNEVPKGEPVVYRKGDEICSLKAEEDIPYCHKVALEDIGKGAEVIKYGESIGEMSQAIAKGHWVSHENLFSVPRDYDREMMEV